MGEREILIEAIKSINLRWNGMSNEIEKKKVEEYNREQRAKMQVGNGKIRIDDSMETDLEDTSWLIEKYKNKEK